MASSPESGKQYDADLAHVLSSLSTMIEQDPDAVKSLLADNPHFVSNIRSSLPENTRDNTGLPLMALGDASHKDSGNSSTTDISLPRTATSPTSELLKSKAELGTGRLFDSRTPTRNNNAPSYEGPTTSGCISVPDLDQLFNELQGTCAPQLQDSKGSGITLIDCAEKLYVQYTIRGSCDILNEATNIGQQALFTVRENKIQLAKLCGNLMIYFKKLYLEAQEIVDLDKLSQAARLLVAVFPKDHAAFPAILEGVGSELHYKFKQTSHLPLLDEAIEISRWACGITPENRRGYAGSLNNLGVLLGDRYYGTRNHPDLEESISVTRKAISLMPDDSLDLGAALCSLGVLLSDEYKRAGTLSFLEEALRYTERSLTKTPKDHRDYPSRLYHLASRLYTMFLHTSERTDLDKAIQVTEQAVAIVPEDHPLRPAALSSLGDYLLTRYKRFEQTVTTCDPARIEAAIVHSRNAIAATPKTHVDMAPRLHNIAIQLEALFQETGEALILEEAIQSEREAIDMTSPGHPILLPMFHTLASLLGDKFGITGNVADLNEVVQFGEEVVAAVSSGDNATLRQFLTFLSSGLGVGLKEAIQVAKRTIALTTDDDDSSLPLYNLGVYLKYQYENSGLLEDLEEYIDVLRQVVAATPDDFYDSTIRRKDLADALHNHHEATGNPNTILEAIKISQKTIASTDEDHPDLPSVFSGLVLSLASQCKSSPATSSYDEALTVARRAIRTAARHDDTKEHAVAMICLSDVLGSRYGCTGDLADLEEAVQVSRRAVAIIVHENSKLVIVLTALGAQLGNRYMALGRMSDLDEGIQVTRRAILLSVSPSNDPSKEALIILSQLLDHRYESTYALADIAEAIHVLKQGLQSAISHPRYTRVRSLNKPVFLCLLADRLGKRYSRTGSLVDQREALQAAREAVAAASDTHEHLPLFLLSLGRQCFNEHVESGNKEALDESIDVIRKALAMTKESPENRLPIILSSLSASIYRRYRISTASTDLEEAIQLLQRANNLIPEKRPEKAAQVNRLADYLVERRDAPETDIREALGLYRVVLHQTNAPTTERIYAAKQIIARTVDWRTIRSVSRLAIDLATRLPLQSMNNVDKQFTLGHLMGIASDAVACELNVNSLSSAPLAAINLLEKGRGLLAVSLQQIRVADTRKLRAIHPKLDEQFAHLQQELERPASHSLSLDLTAQEYSSSSHSLGQGGKRYDAGKAFDELLADIRTLPEFTNFLLPPGDADILGAADRGPIAVINVHESRCDALLVQQGQVRVLPLPGLVKGDIEMRSEDINLRRNEQTLEWLWEVLCRPVLDALGFTQPPQDTREDWPHMWWVPVGPLSKLPLHAAGYHRRQASETVIDRVISSYSSSIKVLIESRRQRVGLDADSGQGKEGEKTTARAMMVSMERTPGQSRLPFAKKEAEAVQNLFQNQCHPHSKLWEWVEPAPRKEEVASHLKECRLFHFAGHGRTGGADSSRSGFLLRDGVLAVGDVFEMNLQARSPFLAYLSACSTGQVRNEDDVDENIHLINAFQMSGFRHVIGTLWEVKDELCVDMAKLTYKEMIKHGITDDAVAYGLHQSTRTLRSEWCTEGRGSREREGRSRKLQSPVVQDFARDIEMNDDDELRPIDWVPYVHFGV